MAGRPRRANRSGGQAPRPRQRLHRIDLQRKTVQRRWGKADSPIERLNIVRAALAGLEGSQQPDAAEVDREIELGAAELWRRLERIWNRRERSAQVKR